jgi:acetylornithine deacetylase/succinyl-diaminopimelate desuccinylase-like protein
LRAEALFFPIPRQDANGRVSLSLGSRRGVIFQLECSGALWGRGPGSHDIHSGMGAIVDNPAQRLVDAIGALVADNGNRVLVEGFYDDALPPDAEQEALLDHLAMQWDEREFKERLGVSTFIDGLTGRAALRRLLFEPTLGLRGIYGGDSRPGDVTVSMAIVPHRAVAKMNASLVPNQNKDDIARKIRAHLDRRGFRDIEMTLRPGTTAEPASWGRVRVSDRIVQALVRTYARYELDPEIWPISPGGWPGHLFQKYLGTPFLAGGVGHGGRAHTSNEYLVVDGNDRVRGLADLEKSFVTLMYEFASG